MANNSSNLLAKLLDEILKINENDQNAKLFMGVLNNDVKAVKAALASGANVNITDSAVVEYYRPLLKERCSQALAEWDVQRSMKSSS